VATQVTTGRGAEIWTHDLSDGTLLRTTTGARSQRPSWLRDGNRIGFMQTDKRWTRRRLRGKAWDGTGAFETILQLADTLSADFVFDPTGGYHAFKRGFVASIWDIWIAPADSLEAMRQHWRCPHRRHRQLDHGGPQTPRA
jgi:hypothetical protein